MIILRRYAPALLLLALWAFGAYHGGRAALAAFQDRATTVDLLEPAQPVVIALQEERRLTAVALAGPGDRAGLLAQRARTDELAASLRRSAGRLRVTWSGPSALADADRLLDRVAALPATRGAVDGGTLERARAMAVYDDAIDAGLRLSEAGFRPFRLGEAGLDAGDGTLPRGPAELARADEMLAREDALVSGAFAAISDKSGRPEAGRGQSGLGEADRAAFAQLVGARRQLRAIAAPDAPGGAAGAPGAGGGPDLLDVALVAAEDGLLRGDAAVDAAAWRGAVDPALSEGRAATTAAARAQADADAGPGAWTIGLAGLFAGLGLIAVLLLYRMFGRRSAVAGGEPADDAVLVRLAQRSQALLHRQLAVLDDLQRRDRDPGELAALFRADQLATQLRRHAERAILLAGLEPGRRWRRPVPLVDVARAAAASVERHVVVMVAAVDAGALAGPAVGAVTHLLTELVDNATRATTGDATVWVGGEMGLTAYTVTVQDRGPGMTARDLAAARDALARPYRPPAPGETPRVGLRLAGRLARAHDIEVELEPAPRGGIVARVRIPVALIVTSEEPADDVAPDLEPSGEHAGGLPVRVPGTVPASAAGFARRGGPRAPVDRTARFRDRLAARGRGAPGTDERETAEIPAQRSTVDDSPQP